MQNHDGSSLNFARHCRLERMRRGWSQAELAREVSRILNQPVHQSTIAKIENLDRRIGIDEAVAISRALSSPLEWMVADEGYDPPGGDGSDIASLEGRLSQARVRLTMAERELRSERKNARDLRAAAVAAEALADEAARHAEACAAQVAYILDRLDRAKREEVGRPGGEQR